MADGTGDGGRRTRREPPSFRWAEVCGVEDLSPRLRRLTLAGPELAGLPPGLPAASVRLLLPRPDGRALPSWEGNEFRWADGSRPTIRTLTPRRTATDGEDPELVVEIVLHGGGALGTWAAAVEPGAPVAVAGTGRGYELPAGTQRLVVAGDETALPAIAVLLESLPPALALEVLVEVAAPEARIDLPRHPGASVRWLDLPPGEPPGTGLLAAVRAAGVSGARLWAAGEAAGVQRLRRHLFDERGLARGDAVVRGYWKHGRAATGAD